MKFTKKQWNNLIFVIILGVLLFTPVGTFVKVKLNQAKMLFSSPDSIEEAHREVIQDFNWNLVDSKGKAINFQEMEGEIVLINFWATWCPPCVAEMPSLNALYEDYKGKIKFVFLANDQPEKVTAYLEKNQYQLPVYYTKNKEPKELHSPSIPTTYLIDDRGKIIMKETGAYNWNSDNVRNQIDELLAFSLAH